MGSEIMEALAPLGSPGHLEVSLMKSLSGAWFGGGWESHFPIPQSWAGPIERNMHPEWSLAWRLTHLLQHLQCSLF